jgi:hypothetical protein
VLRTRAPSKKSLCLTLRRRWPYTSHQSAIKFIATESNGATPTFVFNHSWTRCECFGLQNCIRGTVDDLLTFAKTLAVRLFIRFHSFIHSEPLALTSEVNDGARSKISVASSVLCLSTWRRLSEKHRTMKQPKRKISQALLASKCSSLVGRMLHRKQSAAKFWKH